MLLVVPWKRIYDSIYKTALVADARLHISVTELGCLQKKDTIRHAGVVLSRPVSDYRVTDFRLCDSESPI